MCPAGQLGFNARIFSYLTSFCARCGPVSEAWPGEKIGDRGQIGEKCKAVTTPLEAMRVLDLSRWIAGPFCSLVFGDLGADVVKIESQKGTDDSRPAPPQVNGESIHLMVFNRNRWALGLISILSKGGIARCVGLS